MKIILLIYRGGGGGGHFMKLVITDNLSFSTVTFLILIGYEALSLTVAMVIVKVKSWNHHHFLV